MRPKEYSYGVVPVKKSGDGILFLLVHQRAGHWSFPKGGGEEGENAEQSALRELEEEACVNHCELIPETVFEDRYVHMHHGVECDKEVRYFLGVVISESTLHDDPDGGVIERKWLSYKEAVQQLTFPRLKEIAKEAKEYIDNNPEILTVV